MVISTNAFVLGVWLLVTIFAVAIIGGLLVDGDVSGVEHAVNVPPKQKPVRHFMTAANSVGSDVCRIKSG
jgi:hypothetical protein